METGSASDPRGAVLLLEPQQGCALQLLDSEAGQDALNVIYMQCMAVGGGLKCFERHWPGLLAKQCPEVD